MAALTHSSLLRRETLDERAYFASLMRAARRYGLIDAAFEAALQDELRRLLLRQCVAWCGGRSASIRAEQADSIAQSIQFTLGAYLRTMEPIQALAALRHRGAEACCASGRETVNRRLASVQLAYHSELRRPLPVDNRLLADTFFGGLNGFFRRYNPEYAAHEVGITADYPVLFYPVGFQGIDFIERYLDSLLLEIRLLRRISSEAVRRALNAYALRNQTTARELCDNLLLIVLSDSTREERAALQHSCEGSALSGGLPRILREYERDIARLRGASFSPPD